MRINLISLAKDANDKKSWSGTPYMVLSSLQSMGHVVNVINFLPETYPVYHRILIKLYNLLGKLINKQYLYWFTNLFQRLLIRQYSRMSIPDSDLTFVVGQSFFIPPILPCETRLIYLCDATFSAVENYYPEFSRLYKSVSQQGNMLCKKALYACDRIIMSSNWAKEHAINDYHISESLIEVVEFGANLEASKMGQIKREYTNIKKLKILFSGVHWERKGGVVAVECCDYLIQMGYDIELIIAGVTAPAQYSRPYIRSVGFLNKNFSTEYDQYLKIMEESDILLFPSRAECSAIALCEAASYALPVFAYKTGGLENYVKDGFNGYLLPEASHGYDFAIKIDEAIRTSVLQELSDNATTLYRQRLNWNTWRNRVNTIISSLD